MPGRLTHIRHPRSHGVPPAAEVVQLFDPANFADIDPAMMQDALGFIRVLNRHPEICHWMVEAFIALELSRCRDMPKPKSLQQREDDCAARERELIHLEERARQSLAEAEQIKAEAEALRAAEEARRDKLTAELRALTTNAPIEG